MAIHENRTLQQSACAYIVCHRLGSCTFRKPPTSYWRPPEAAGGQLFGGELGQVGVTSILILLFLPKQPTHPL